MGLCGRGGQFLCGYLTRHQLYVLVGSDIAQAADLLYLSGSWLGGGVAIFPSLPGSAVDFAALSKLDLAQARFFK